MLREKIQDYQYFNQNFSLRDKRQRGSMSGGRLTAAAMPPLVIRGGCTASNHKHSTELPVCCNFSCGQARNEPRPAITAGAPRRHH